MVCKVLYMYYIQMNVHFYWYNFGGAIVFHFSVMNSLKKKTISDFGFKNYKSYIHSHSGTSSMGIALIERLTSITIVSAFPHYRC